MINIIDIGFDGKIIFSLEKTLENVNFIILDENYNGEVYITQFEKIERGGNYFVMLRSVVIPYLERPYIQITDSHNNIYQKHFNFPTDLIGNYSLIGNSCVAWRTYEVANTSYNSPTIGNLILDDEEYVRFCEHIDTYLNAEMIIGETKGNINFKKQTGHTRIVNPESHVTDDYHISHH